MAFRVLIIGGTGQVGTAVVRALDAQPPCAEIVIVNRKAIPLTASHRVRQVILDTAATEFPAAVTTLAKSMVALGDPVYGHPVSASGKAAMRGPKRNLRPSKSAPSVVSAAAVTTEAWIDSRSSRQRDVHRKAGYVMHESWG
jgi:hypothetical protein